MRSLRFRVAPVLGALLAGCAAPRAQEAKVLPDPAPAPPPVATNAAPSGIDGLYRGSSTRYQADRRDCPHPGLVTLYVQDRQFNYRWNGLVDVPGAIGPDGSVSGQEGAIALSGRMLGGDQIQGDLTNGACALHFTVRRRFSGA